jgi:hypothetical protein
VGLEKGFWVSEEVIWLREKVDGAWVGVLGAEGHLAHGKGECCLGRVFGWGRQ